VVDSALETACAYRPDERGSWPRHSHGRRTCARRTTSRRCGLP